MGKGVKYERARRRDADPPDLDDWLDSFHTLRAGWRAQRKTWSGASGALWCADPTQKEFDWRDRQGLSCQGQGTPLHLLWRMSAGTRVWASVRNVELTKSCTDWGAQSERVRAVSGVRATRRNASAELRECSKRGTKK